jgi:hypothetical protein
MSASDVPVSHPFVERLIGQLPHIAPLAPPRTWSELKEAVQQRADRNAYPMTGMKPDDVREILSGIDSLDRDDPLDRA